MPTYLQVTLRVADKNRAAAAGVYTEYKEPFLNTIPGAQSKSLLVRTEDVQDHVEIVVAPLLRPE